MQASPPVIGFNGEFRFLSNFFPYQVTYEGLTYLNTEAAFQAAKVLDNATRRKFTSMTPGESKKEGRRVKLRTDWEQVKIGIMKDILCEKFTDPRLRSQLLATGDGHIEERNTWGDRIWGTTAPGVGQNLLGILLMEIRSEIQAALAEVVFEGREKSTDYAIRQAEMKLGKLRQFCDSERKYLFEKAGWCKLVWETLPGGNIASAPGLPTITLPRKFSFVKILA